MTVDWILQREVVPVAVVATSWLPLAVVTESMLEFDVDRRANPFDIDGSFRPDLEESNATCLDPFLSPFFPLRIELAGFVASRDL